MRQGRAVDWIGLGGILQKISKVAVMDNKISPANDGQHRHDDVNDKVRKTFGQNPQNLAYLGLS